MERKHDAVPLPTLLSQALVAFTIEFDNESEHQMRHRTTTGGRDAAPRGGAWLASQVMWANVMQYVDEDGVRVQDLQARARTAKSQLAGLQRWGYITVGPHPDDRRPKPRPGDLVVRPTAAGRRAQAVWKPLGGVVEQRWRDRFGPENIAALRESLHGVRSGIDLDLPQYLPIVGYGLFAEVWAPDRRPAAGDGPEDGPHLDLSVLLAQVLLAFTLEFEQQSKVSLAISANTLRVLSSEGVRVRDLPQLTGIAKEAISMSTGFLARRGYVVIEPDPTATRGKIVRLTPKGATTQAAGERILASTEQRWEARFDVGTLRASLQGLVGDGTRDRSALFGGLEPYPDGWRASLRRPDVLPHHPTVLHRGGYPDGS